MQVPGIKSVAELLGDRYTPEFQAAFPDITPPYRPFGYLALIQLRVPSEKIGSIIKPDDEKDRERYRTQAALVRDLGAACFKDRQTGADWVEGAWYAPGDFIRSPMFGGDRLNIDFEVPAKPGSTLTVKKQVTFMFIKEADAIALVTGDPLNITVS